MTKPGVAFRICFVKVPNNDSTYYSQRLTFIKRTKNPWLIAKLSAPFPFKDGYCKTLALNFLHTCPQIAFICLIEFPK